MALTALYASASAMPFAVIAATSDRGLVEGALIAGVFSIVNTVLTAKVLRVAQANRDAVSVTKDVAAESAQHLADLAQHPVEPQEKPFDREKDSPV